MGNFTIFERDSTLEELKKDLEFERYETKQSSLVSKNAFLTGSLVFGASLISPGECSIQPEDIQLVNSNEIGLTKTYNEKINEGFLEFVDELNNISKRKISKNSLIKEIITFKALVQSWDGYGAYPLSVESTVNSIDLLDKIGEEIFCTVNNFFPNPNGTITFEWENSQNEMLSLEIGESTFSYFVELASSDVKFFNDIPINDKEAKKLSQFIQAI